jgi:hypothetical protein
MRAAISECLDLGMHSVVGLFADYAAGKRTYLVGCVPVVPVITPWDRVTKDVHKLTICSHVNSFVNRMTRPMFHCLEFTYSDC